MAKLHSTNYVNAFIEVAEDSPTDKPVVPEPGRTGHSVALLQFSMLCLHPYWYTSDDVIFEVFAIRHSIPVEDRPPARQAFFARPQACLRASPLPKMYGWGIHADTEGRVALVGIGTEEYGSLAADGNTRHLRALRNRRP